MISAQVRPEVITLNLDPAMEFEFDTGYVGCLSFSFVTRCLLFPMPYLTNWTVSHLAILHSGPFFSLSERLRRWSLEAIGATTSRYRA
jgi:hypothetical protein